MSQLTPHIAAHTPTQNEVMSLGLYHYYKGNPMTQINAYLTFNGNCGEAMTFYKECLGGELSMQTVEGTPMEKQVHPSALKKIIHATLTKESMVLMASDMVGRAGFILGNTVSLAVNCSSPQEIHSFFNKLAEGGQITDPLRDQFWGGTFGALIDKFGVNWLFNYDKNAL